jgi:hypothetical protein
MRRGNLVLDELGEAERVVNLDRRAISSPMSRGNSPVIGRIREYLGMVETH